MEQRLNSPPSWVFRLPLRGLGIGSALFLLLTLPWVLSGSNAGIDSMFNGPLLWVDHDAPSRRDFNAFIERFGAHEMIVISWDGADVDDPRLDSAAEALTALDQARQEEGKERFFNQVLTGKTMLDALTDPPIQIPYEAALKRLEGVLVGADRQTSCLVAELTDYGGIQRRETIPAIRQTLAQATGLPTTDLIMSGPSIDGMAIDDESIRSIKKYSLPSVIISLVLCWVCLRSLWLTIPILVIGIWGQGFMLALVHASGATMNAILIVLPPLVFMLTVSAGIHLANYFLEELAQGAGPQAPYRALLKAIGPCFLAAATTVIGLASLCISEVAPVRQFGWVGSVGLSVCVLLLFLLIPGMMKLREQWRGVPTTPASPVPDLTPVDRGPPRFSFLSNWIYRHAFLIRWGCAATMLLCGYGLFHLRTSVDVFSLLDEKNRAVEDFHWIESRIGPLVPIEVVIEFDRDCTLDTLYRAAVVAAVQRKLSNISGLDGEMSAVTFMPPLPRSGGLGGSVRKSAFVALVQRSRQSLIAGSYLADTPSGEAWRISARIPGLAQYDYGDFLQLVDAEVGEVIGQLDPVHQPHIQTSSTGVLMLVHRIQEALLVDLFNSYLSALVLVTLVMMFSLRSILGGLIAMLPNLFPTVVMFGLLGWNGQSIDIGSVMTASVALGIAVDGTFHFLKWFIHATKQGASQAAAISSAFHHCGRSLIQTTLICACGLLVYSWSDFLPARNFAWILMLMLVTALVGDMILLPSLLASTLGRRLQRLYAPPQVYVDAMTGSAPPAPPRVETPVTPNSQS